MLPTRNKVLTGVAGEYYVAAELSKLGYIASITLRNTRGVDILCSNPDGSKSVSIQVKTRTGSRHTWIVSEKGENHHSLNFFYVFVNLTDTAHPEYSIVPSKVVADYAREGHVTWLKVPKRDGGAHKDNSMRKFRDLEKKYLNAWHLLGLD